MKITTKAILTVGLALLSLTLTLYFVLSDISVDNFSQLEAKQVTRNVDRAVNAISSEITDVDTTTLDWAWWDDTYTFIEDSNASYQRSNLGEDTFEGLSLNLIVYINSAGQTVFSSGFDSEQGLIPVPESLEPHLSSDSPLVHHSEAESRVAGILLLPEGPLIIAAQPILPSNGEGPIRGSLIFGRYLDDALVKALSEMTQVEIHISQYDNLPLSPEIEAAQASLSPQAVYVSPLDEDYVVGYTFLKDIYDQPALLLQAIVPREIYAQGQASTYYLRMAIIIVGIVAIIAIFLLLDKQLLSRLTSITKGVARIGKMGDTSSRLVTKGKDELADLGNSINQTLDALQTSQQKIAESEGRLRLIFESVNDILILMNTEGRIQEVNSRVRDIVGYEKEELVGKRISTLGNIMRRRSLGIIVDNFKKRMAGIEVPSYEVEIIRKDGSPATFEISGVVVRKEGNIVGDLVIARDITAGKKAEAELRQSEMRYRLLAENLTDVIWTTAVSCPERLTYISLSVTRLLGYSVEEAMSKKMEEIFTRSSFKRAMEAFAEEIANEEKQSREPLVSRVLELDLNHADGSIVSVEVNYSFIRGADGRPSEILAIARDITERKKMEEKVKRAANEWRTTFDSITDWISILDSDFRFVRVNKAFANAFGKKPKELLGRTCYELVHNTSEPVPNCPHRRTLLSKRPATAEFFEPNLGVYLEMTTSPIFDEGGRVSGTVHATRDITERKHMQEQLLMTDRLASIGELVSGVAHELNNPLTSIIGFSQLLMNGDVPPSIKEDLGLVHGEAQRAATIVKNLLTFARKHGPVRQVSQINNIIEDVVRLRAYEQKVNNIEVDRQFASDLPEIMVDYFQMQQVFLNIIINAEYFMTQAHNKGKLTITIERANQVIRVSFADDGPGIPKENLNRIFNPFFTTKDVGKGTGLGLSICHGIVTEHGGSIYVESELGKGATFVVELPVSLS
jgi:PAS domain S-box-containing protein